MFSWKGALISREGNESGSNASFQIPGIGNRTGSVAGKFTDSMKTTSGAVFLTSAPDLTLLEPYWKAIILLRKINLFVPFGSNNGPKGQFQRISPSFPIALCLQSSLISDG